jgi:hypothetical protein
MSRGQAWTCLLFAASQRQIWHSASRTIGKALCWLQLSPAASSNVR